MSAQIVAGLLDAAVRDGAALSRSDVLLLSPYRLQSRLLQKAADDVLGIDERVASTVHRAQGDEARTVVFDATYSHNKHTVPKWFEGEGLGSDTARLTNVALSRAQDQIVVLADAARLVRRMPKEAPRSALQSVLRANDLGASVVLDKIAGGAFTWFAAGSGATLLAELAGAKGSISLHLSSFRDVDREALLDVAYLAEENGIETSMVPGLDTPSNVSWRDLDDFVYYSLRPKGVVVDLRTPTWENFAVIDGEVLWASQGSLFEGGTPAYRTVGSGLAGEVLNVSGFAKPSNFVTRPARGRATDDCPTCGHGRVAVDEWQVFRAAWQVVLRCVKCRELGADARREH